MNRRELPMMPNRRRWPVCLGLTLVAASLAAAWVRQTSPVTEKRATASPGNRGATQAVPGGHATRPEAPTSARDVAVAGPLATESRVALPPPSPVDTPVAAGNVIYIDPNTGWPGQPPSGSLVLTGNLFSTSSAGLEEVLSPVQGGGFLVHLRGRFHNAMTVAVTPGGQAVASCQPAAADPDALNSAAPTKAEPGR